jgi:hypothetical protein
MSCCGRRRAAIDARPITGGASGARPAVPTTPIAPTAAVAFVYTGATRLVAEGSITRRRYRFDHPGAIVEVDARDAVPFTALAQLRRRR